MVTETHQISNLRSQGVSEEILSDLVRKMLPSLKFFHFQYAPGKCVRRHYFARYCKSVSHQYYATNQDTKPHILSQSCPKIGVDQCLSFFICHNFFYYAAFFSLTGKLKYIICLPYDISNDIIQSYQFNRRILPLLPLIASNVD